MREIYHYTASFLYDEGVMEICFCTYANVPVLI